MSEPIRSLDEIGLSLDSHLNRGAEEWIAAGKDLSEAKALVSHGEWLPWLKEHELSDRSAQKLIRIHEIFRNTPLGADFSKKTLDLLAAPSTPEPVRKAALAKAEAGEKVTQDSVREMIAAEKPPQAKTTGRSDETPHARDVRKLTDKGYDFLMWFCHEAVDKRVTKALTAHERRELIKFLNTAANQFTLIAQELFDPEIMELDKCQKYDRGPISVRMGEVT